MSHDQFAHRILTEIEDREHLSQRSLARDLGIALGLTNLLVSRLVHQGWVRIIRIKRNRVRYLLTPAGIAEKTRMSCAALQESIRFYAETRDHIRERFAVLSRELLCDSSGSENVPGAKRIVFYGAGEVAEVGYICLHGTDLHLVGVVDSQRQDRFFDFPVYKPAQLHAADIDGSPFDRLIVMSFGEIDTIKEQLESLTIPPNRIFWIDGGGEKQIEAAGSHSMQDKWRS